MHPGIRRLNLVVILFLALNCESSQGQIECRDKNALCGTWSDRGVCTTQENFMREHCPKTCGFCNRGTTPIVFPRPTIRNPEFVCGRFTEGVFSSRQKRQIDGSLEGIGGSLDSFKPSPGPVLLKFRPNSSGPDNRSSGANTDNISIPKPGFTTNPSNPIFNFTRTSFPTSITTTTSRSRVPARVPIPITTPLPQPTASPDPVGGGENAVTPGVGVIIPEIPPKPPVPGPTPVPGPRPIPVPVPVTIPSESVTGGPPTHSSIAPTGIQRPNPTPNPMRLTTEEVTPAQEVRLEDAICGSAPITDQFLLSAAHCFPDPSKKFRVIVGDLDLSKQNEANSKPQNLGIEKIFIHPDYRHSTGIRYNDIALLKTEQRIEFSPLVYPLCILPRPTDLSGAPLTVSGFGFVNATHRSPVLQEAVLEGINADNCETRYRNEDYEIVLRVTYPELLIDKGLLCAAAPGKDACEGDSGGPLTIRDITGRNYLIGIVSVGAPCTGNSFSILPGLYTDVAHYADWIDSVIYGV